MRLHLAIMMALMVAQPAHAEVAGLRVWIAIDDGAEVDAAGLADAVADLAAAELHVLAIDPCVGCRLELAPG